MRKPFVVTALLASLAAGTLLLLGLNAASLEGRMVFEGDTISLPLVISGKTSGASVLCEEYLATFVYMSAESLDMITSLSLVIRAKHFAQGPIVCRY